MEIQGYENYLIYPDGRVQNKKTKRIMKPAQISNGYNRIGLFKDGKQETSAIHRLVALHYIPNPENKLQVDHINRIRNDNRVENLRWVTHSENRQNTGQNKSNTSGHKYISYDRSAKNWRFTKRINYKKYNKCFKSKIDALCYKFIILFKIKTRFKITN
tara:strand:- start:25 stop:501 length:477 start_codon:yes stop_codon:yes gene_type:complete